MTEYIHTQSGARVSVADGKVLGVDFVPVDGSSERSEAPDKSWKVAELKTYAEEQGIELGDATKKDDILAVIAGGGDDSDAGESDEDADETDGDE